MKRTLHILYGLLVRLVLVMFCPFHVHAQDQKPINLNQENGLPTDFLYDMTVDKYGYLWLATPKGAVKYNGYQTKTFGFSAGLPNEDVWAVFADKYGRVFCASHANEIGYVKNDRFKPLKNVGFNSTLCPWQFRMYKNGVAWIDYNILYYERNDSLYKQSFDNIYYSALNDKNEIYRISRDLYYEVIRHADSAAHITRIKGPIDKYPFESLSVIRSAFEEDILLILPPSDTLWIINKDSSYCRSYGQLLGEHAKCLSLFEKNEKLYLKFDKGFISLNRDYSVAEVFRFDKKWYGGLDGNTIPVTYRDQLWDTCIITNTRGLFLLPDSKVRFTKISDSLNGYKLIKDIGNSTAIWWNVAKHRCIILKKRKIVASLDVDKRVSISTVAIINDSSIFLFTSTQGGYWFYSHQSIFGTDTATVGHVSSAVVDTQTKKLYYLQGNSLYWAPTSNISHLNAKALIDERYSEVLYDQFYKAVIIYKYNKILLIKNGKTLTLDKKFLNRVGIGYIERIRTDDKGNFFVKDNEKVVCINIERHIYKPLFTHANFSDAKMTLNKDLLVLAGSFGISFYKIDKELSLKNCVYRNIKNVYYRHLYDLQINSKDIVFTSDKGNFIVPTPDENEFTADAADDVKYRVLAKYGNDVHVFSTGKIDTICMLQRNLMLDLDVINPSGTGTVSYSYSTGERRKTVSGSQLFLNELVPDSYYDLSIIASDNSWISTDNKIVVYIIPFWWQTSNGKIIIALCFVLFILGMAFAVFLLTRAAIRKRNERNQLRMDIELKSIYSQINPHFIFNTLSGTQYFIRENKNQDARLHLNKFSRLLRSYIHSSRNKYISIKDELANLVNYIELQQIRFTDKFDYQITIAEDLQTDNVKIPSLLLQPIVENAVNHGLFHIEGYKGLLKLEFYQDLKTREIVCVIDDNGIGRQKAKEIKADSIIKTQSYGDALIKDLINIFNKYEKLNIEIKYIDKKDQETGTIVIIRIKNPIYESS